MRKIKYLIALIILFLSVGFAALNTNLDITASTIVKQIEDFDVYYSDVRVNGVQDITVVDSSNEISFIPNLENGKFVVDYDVTNGSKNYDANVSVNCTSDGNNIKIINEFDTSTVLEAYENRSGKVTIEPLQSWTHTDSDGSGTITVGDVCTLLVNQTQKFNVISQTADTITMLAKQVLGSSNPYYIQSNGGSYDAFSRVTGWEYTPGPKEIDIQVYDGGAKKIVNAYVAYLQTVTVDTTISGNLITLNELKALGCTGINEDYSKTGTETCANSPYKDWLIINASLNWWTRSADSTNRDSIWSVTRTNSISSDNFDSNGLFRPVITISKTKIFNSPVTSDTEIYNSPVTCTIEATPVENYILGDGELPDALEKCKWEYTDSDNSGDISTGDEYTYCSESFNVISKTDDTVTMLAQYSLGTNYRQTKSTSWRDFYVIPTFNITGSTTVPVDLDIFTMSPNFKTYVNEYISFLQQEMGYPRISGNVITLNELKALGCTGINEDYSKTGTETCVNSPYKDWLVNGQAWWTRSRVTTGGSSIWYVSFNGELGDSDSFSGTYGVRPTITIPIDALNNIPYPYKVGNEIDIDGEKFNVISETDTTVTMLAQYNLGANYRQSDIENVVTFSDKNGWEVSPGPKEVDIQVWSTNPKKYVNEYVSFLQEETGDSSISGNLITLTELLTLGCVATSDYSLSSLADPNSRTCVNSQYADWLRNGKRWWTRSAVSDVRAEMGYIFMVTEDGGLYYGRASFDTSTVGTIRPVITISKEGLENYLNS